MRELPRPGWAKWTAGVLLVWSLLNGFSVALQLGDDDPAARSVATGVGLTLAGLVLAWLVWRPRRVPEPDPLGKAVARPSWWLRLGGFFAAVIGGAVAKNAWGLAREGDPAFDGIGRVLVSGVLGLVGLALLLVAWGIWWIRQTIDPSEATSRMFFTTSRIRRDQATRVQTTDSTVHAGLAGGKIPVDRIVVEGPNQHGIPTRAAFDATMTNEEQALAVLDGWVRERPQLVQDDATRALFEARGALPAAP